MAVSVNKIIYNQSKTVNCYGGYSGYVFRLEVKENSYDILTNKSNITIIEYAKAVSSGGYEDYGSVYLNVNYYDNKDKQTINKISKTVSSIWPRNTEICIGTWTGDVEHNADGSLNISVQSALTHAYTSGWMPPQNLSFDTGTLSLTTIPRKTTCPNVVGTIEESTTIKINPATNSFTHSLKFTLGSNVKYLDSSGNLSSSEVKLSGSSFTFKVPSEYYNQFTESGKTGSVLLTTYNGTTQIGTDTATLTINTSSSKCKPVLTSGTLIDVNSVTAQLTSGSSTSNSIVKGYSNGKLDFGIRISSSNDSKATITTLKIDNSSVSTSTRTKTFNNISKKTIDIYIKNSRGVEVTYSVSTTGSLVDYVPLTLKAVPKRPSQTGNRIVIDYSGNYFNSSFGNTANTLTMSWSYKEKGETNYTSGGTITPALNGNSYSGQIDCGNIFNYKKQYEFIVYFADKLVNSNSGVLPVKKGIENFAIYQNAIKINDTFLTEETLKKLNNIFNFVYPVGSIYMSMNSTNPGTLFGGTWEQLKEVFLFGASENYAVGSTGGEKTHTLTIAEMPKHKHPFTTVKSVELPLDDTALASAYNSNNTGVGFAYTDETGESKAHNNMPPYIAVYMWKRKA